MDLPDRVTRSATSTRISTSSRRSCSGPGSGRWPVDSRRSRAVRLRRVRVPRSVGRRGPHRGPRRAGISKRVPTPRRQGRAGARELPVGVHLPVPWLVLWTRRQEHIRVRGRGHLASTTSQAEEINLTPVQCEVWGGCAWINLDATAPPLRQCIEPSASILDGWELASLRTGVVVRLPAPRELEACRGGVHGAVPRASNHTRSSGIPSRIVPPRRQAVRPAAFVDGELQYLRTMSEGMAGMVHANDLRDRRGASRGHRAAAGPGAGHGDLAAAH